MFRNINPFALGVLARQSELIELVLTFGFQGLDVDISDFVKRAESSGIDGTAELFQSAELRVGSFELPLDLEAEEADFQSELEGLETIGKLGAALRAACCYTVIRPASSSLPYHENFERHRVRLAKLAEMLWKYGVRLGISLCATSAERQAGDYQFVYEAEPFLTLFNAVGSPDLGICLDTWQWHVGGGTLDQIRELDPKRIASVILADVPSDVALETIESHQRLLPGQGEGISAVELLGWLAESKYKGPITLAPDPQQFESQSRDATMRQVREVMDQLWTDAGLDSSGKKIPVARD